MERNNQLSTISHILLVVDIICLIGLYLALVPTKNAFGNYIVIFTCLTLIIKERLKNKVATLIINVVALLSMLPFLCLCLYYSGSPVRN